MQLKTTMGRVGPLIVAAAAVATACGAGTFLIQRPDSATTTVAVTLRSHDGVVFWPNHTAVQRSAVASVNNAEGQRAIRSAIDQPDLLVSVQATALGDPASVEIRAVAASVGLATEAAVAAGELAVADAIQERTVPLRAEIDAIAQELPIVSAERDDLLTQAIEGDLTTAQRVATSEAGEAAASVASVLETDLARLEADLAAQKSPLVLIDNPQEVDLPSSALRSALAAALGIFFVSLLGFSLLGQPKESAPTGRPVIDLTDVPKDSIEHKTSVKLSSATIE